MEPGSVLQRHSGVTLSTLSLCQPLPLIIALGIAEGVIFDVVANAFAIERERGSLGLGALQDFL
jgi:hypothetical protein